MVSGFIHQSVWMLCYSCIFSFPNLVLEALLSAGSTSLLKLVSSNFPDCFFTGDHLSTIYKRLYCRYTDTLILSDQLAIVIVMFKAFHFSTHEKRDFTKGTWPGTSIMRKTPMTQEWKEFEHHNFSTQGIHGFPCADSCITPFLSLFWDR